VLCKLAGKVDNNEELCQLVEATVGKRLYQLAGEAIEKDELCKLAGEAVGNDVLCKLVGEAFDKDILCKLSGEAVDNLVLCKLVGEAVDIEVMTKHWYLGASSRALRTASSTHGGQHKDSTVTAATSFASLSWKKVE